MAVYKYRKNVINDDAFLIRSLYITWSGALTFSSPECDWYNNRSSLAKRSVINVTSVSVMAALITRYDASNYKPTVCSWCRHTEWKLSCHVIIVNINRSLTMFAHTVEKITNPLQVKCAYFATVYFRKKYIKRCLCNRLQDSKVRYASCNLFISWPVTRCLSCSGSGWRQGTEARACGVMFSHRYTVHFQCL